MTHVWFFVWFMIFGCAPYRKQTSPLWQACNHSWRWCILCNYHAHGAGGKKKWCTDWWITFKVVHQLCVCSMNMFINMQYIQWGQFRNFLFLMVIIHLLKNSDFIWKLCVLMRQVFCISDMLWCNYGYMLIVIQSLTPVGHMCYADKTQKKGNNSKSIMHFTHICTTESADVSIKITYQSNANAYLWWSNFKCSCHSGQLYVCIQQTESPKRITSALYTGGW